MQRVMIVGGPGSGKSTLARWIGAQTGLPVQHMDQIHWLPDWVERTTEEKLPMIMAVEATDCWIIEGGVSSRYGARLARADMLIWLDLPVGLRLWRVVKRSWLYRGRARPDLPEGCPERLNRETLGFLIWIWKNRNTMRQKVVNAVEADDGCTVTYHLRSREAVRAFQSAMERT